MSTAGADHAPDLGRSGVVGQRREPLNGGGVYLLATFAIDGEERSLAESNAGPAFDRTRS